MAEWPDPEDQAAHVLGDLVDHQVVSTLAGVTGPGGEDWRNLPEEALPIIRATLLGGTDDAVSDWSRLEVVVYTATRAQARALAEAVRERFLPGPHRTPAGVIDRVETEMRPAEQQTADPARIRRWRAVYRMSTRQRPPQ